MKYKTFIKLQTKIRDNYYLIRKIEGEDIVKHKNDIIQGWRLTDHNFEDVMTSDKNTDEELIEFVKKHSIYGLQAVLKVNLILVIICTIMLLINTIFIRNELLRCCILAAEMYAVIINMVVINMSRANMESNLLDAREQYKRARDRALKEYEDEMKKLEEKRNI